MEYIIIVISFLGVVALFFIFFQLKKMNKNQLQFSLRQEEKADLISKQIDQNNARIGEYQQELNYNKLVPIIYKQIDRFEEALNLFQFENLTGFKGFKYLNAKLELKKSELYETGRFDSVKTFNAIKVYELKELLALESLSYFAFEAKKTVQSVENLLLSSECNEQQMNQLRSLFIDNINAQYFVFFENFNKVIKKKAGDLPEHLNSKLIIKESFLKNNELAKNLKHILDFKNQALSFNKSQ